MPSSSAFSMTPRIAGVESLEDNGRRGYPLPEESTKDNIDPERCQFFSRAAMPSTSCC